MMAEAVRTVCALAADDHRLLLGVLAAVLCCGLAPAQSSLTVASRIVASANGFLSSLDEGQRSKVLFEFNDAAQRMKWSNLPTTMVPRAGLKMGDLSGPQRKAAMDLYPGGITLEQAETLLRKRATLYRELAK